MELNQFYVGDTVRSKDNPDQIMKVTSNVPGGGIGEDYLQTNKFACDWEEKGQGKSVVFHGSKLELVERKK